MDPAPIAPVLPAADFVLQPVTGLSIVMGVPQNRWFIRENPIKMDDLEVSLFLEYLQLISFFLDFVWNHPTFVHRYISYIVRGFPWSWGIPFIAWWFIKSFERNMDDLVVSPWLRKLPHLHGIVWNCIGRLRLHRCWSKTAGHTNISGFLMLDIYFQTDP